MTIRSSTRQRVASTALALSLLSCAAVVSFDDYGASPVPPRPVIVHVTTAEALAITGAVVVFHDAEGAVLDVQRTASDGRATSRSAAKQVTVALPTLSREPLELTTFMGVEGGDELTLATLATGVPPPVVPIAHINVTVPSLGPGASYDVRVARADLEALRAELSSDRHDGIGLDVFAGELDADGALSIVARGSTPQASAYIGARHVRLTDAMGPVFDLQGPWRAPDIVKVSVPPAPIPARADDTWVDVTALVGEHPALLLAKFRVTEQTSPLSEYAIPSGFADDVLVRTEASTSRMPIDPDHDPSWSVFERASADTGFTVGLTDLPAVSAAVDVTDPKRPVLSWSAAHAGIVGARAIIHRGTSAGGEWTIVLPPGRREARAPELPVDLAAQLPSLWSVDSPPFVELEVADGDAVPDFASYKRLGISNGVRIPPKGRLRLSRTPHL